MIDGAGAVEKANKGSRPGTFRLKFKGLSVCMSSLKASKQCLNLDKQEKLRSFIFVMVHEVKLNLNEKF